MLNPKDAPEGYIAVRVGLGLPRCHLCVFDKDEEEVEHQCDGLECSEFEREDGCNVYFIRKIDKALRKYPPAFRELLK